MGREVMVEDGDNEGGVLWTVEDELKEGGTDGGELDGRGWCDWKWKRSDVDERWMMLRLKVGKKWCG